VPRKRIISPLQVILLAILIALVVTWIRTGHSRKGAKNETAAEAQSQTAFPADSVSEIDVERGGVTFRLIREAGTFWLHEPYRDRADAQLVAQSLRVAATLEPLRVLPDTTASPFGLNPPTSVWRCVWPRGTYQVLIGDSLPGGGGRYVKRTGSPAVIVVDDFLARRYLAPSIRSLHDPIAAPMGVGPIDSVRITTREENITIVRRTNEFWEIVSPFKAEAATAELLRAVQALRTASISAVLGPRSGQDLRALGLDPPRALWTLVQGGRRATVVIGHPTADQRSVHVIPDGRDVVALIDSESFRIWVDGLARLREGRAFRAAADSVTRVVVQRGGERRTFAKPRERGWIEIAGADTLEVQQDVFAQALNNLCAARVSSFNTPWLGEDDKVIRIRVLYKRGEQDSLDFAPVNADLSPVRGGRLPGRCAVPGAYYRTWSNWLRRPLRP